LTKRQAGINELAELLQVPWQSLADSLGGQTKARHNIDGPLQRQLPGLDVLEGVHYLSQHVPIPKRGAAVACPQPFQALSNLQLFLTTE
jgi:hypothetical protein